MLKNDVFENIHDIGLSEKETAVYAALTELGGAFPSRLSEITKLNRSTVYKILLDLSVKGLVNEIKKKNKLYYQIEKPQKLLRFAKDQITLANERFERVQKAIPELESLFSMVSNKPKVLFFDGPDTIQSICTDMVTVEGNYEMLAFSNAKKFKNYLPQKQLREFIKAKERLNITTRAITPDTTEDREYSASVFRGIKKKIWPVMKHVPEKKFPYEAEITIYGKNKVSITKLSKENVIGVIIEDEIIHNMLRMVFEISWDGLK